MPPHKPQQGRRDVPVLLVVGVNRHGFAIAADDDTPDRSSIRPFEHDTAADLDLLQSSGGLLSVPEQYSSIVGSSAISVQLSESY